MSRAIQTRIEQWAKEIDGRAAELTDYELGQLQACNRIAGWLKDANVSRKAPVERPKAKKGQSSV